MQIENKLILKIHVRESKAWFRLFLRSLKQKVYLERERWSQWNKDIFLYDYKLSEVVKSPTGSTYTTPLALMEIPCTYARIEFSHQTTSWSR